MDMWGFVVAGLGGLVVGRGVCVCDDLGGG